MSSYSDIISELVQNSPVSRKWWPTYFYHYTDINNAISIIDTEWILGRLQAESQHLVKTDAASQNVLNITSNTVKSSGRLYFRPLTPTQYNNEGYRPPFARKIGLEDACCPVPIFFLLDAEKTLSLPNVQISERGGAGQAQLIEATPENYASLTFNKIYHHGPHEHGSDISQYRRSEVLLEGGFPLSGTLARIICRSPAERQTLLHLLSVRNPHRYAKYRDIITCALPDVKRQLYFMQGVYIEEVKILDSSIYIRFNEATTRKSLNKHDNVFVEVIMHLTWRTPDGTMIRRELAKASLNYFTDNAVKLSFREKYSDYLDLEIKFDDALVFSDSLSLTDHILI